MNPHVLLRCYHAGSWRHVDLSYNNLGAGAAMVLGGLAEKMAQVSERMSER
jgi:hypothetical protein